jgi:hypothetical protein
MLLGAFLSQQVYDPIALMARHFVADKAPVACTLGRSTLQQP